MAEFNWTAYDTIATYLSTELNSLADGANKTGAEIDNGSSLDLYADFELNLASLTPTAGGYVRLTKIIALDDTNYEDGSDSVDPPEGADTWTRGLRATTAAQRVVIPHVLMSPGKQKFILTNEAGVSFGASGNTLKYRVYSEQSV